MESEEYKEMCKIVIRNINNRKDEINKAIKYEKKNRIGKPSREIWCNDCFMLQRFSNWEEIVEPKYLFCGQAKLDIYDTLYLPD